MKTEKEIKEALEYLKKQFSGSSNMNYERGGAIEVLEWILDDKREGLPTYIGMR